MGHPGIQPTVGSPRRAQPTPAPRRSPRRRGAIGGAWDGPGRQGPPPWVAGLFGLGPRHEQQRGPRVRRGDVRAAILDVLAAAADERRAGQRLPGHPADRRAQRAAPGGRAPARSTRRSSSSRTRGWWRPTTSAAARRSAHRRGRGSTSPTHADELADVWRPFDGQAARSSRGVLRASSRRSARSWARCGRSSPPAPSAAAPRRHRRPRRDPAQALRHARRRRRRARTRRATTLTDQHAPAQRRRAGAGGGRPGRALRPGPADRRRARRAARAGLGRKTRGELAPIFRDLPSPYAPAAVRASRSPRAPARSPGTPAAAPPPRAAGPARGGAGRARGASPCSTHLPIILFGLLVWFILAERHGARRRRRRWLRRVSALRYVDPPAIAAPAARRSTRSTPPTPLARGRRSPGHSAVDPVRDVGRQVLVQVAQPEVVAPRAVLDAQQPDHGAEREARGSSSTASAMLAARDRPVDQPLRRRPALPDLVDAPRRWPPAAVLVVVPQLDERRRGRAARSACRAGVRRRTGARSDELGDVQVDDPGRLLAAAPAAPGG